MLSFSGPDICSICCNYDNTNLLVKCPLLKKCPFMDLVCSVHLVNITTGFNRSLHKKWHFLNLKCLIHVKTKHRSLLPRYLLLKKWHFLDLVCSIHVVTIKVEFSYSNRSLLKKWHILDLICAIHVVTMRTEVYFVK